MKRPDASIIRRALKGGRLVLGDKTKLDEIIKLGLDLPLMSFAGKDFVESDIWAFEKTLDQDTTSEPVFDEWVIHYEQGITLETRGRVGMAETIKSREKKHAEVWACFLNPMHPYLKKLNNYPQTIDEHVAGFERGFKNTVLPETIRFAVVLVEYKGEPATYIWQGWTACNGSNQIAAMATEGSEEYWEEAISGLTQWAMTSSIHCLSTWAYCKYGDKHMVEVVPTKPKSKQARRSALNKSRPWNSSTGPHILFLDRMPTTQSGGGTGSGTSPKPHRRRGHWKTLSHPRFRHHPQYGKQIYVKPSFVGPRQVTYEGNIYRLVEPLEGEV